MIAFFIEQNPYAAEIVPTISTLAGAVRGAGGVVAWVVPATVSAEHARADFFGPAVATTYRRSGGTGPIVERLWPAFDVDEADVLAQKTAPSAFFPGRGDLVEQLEARGVDTVLIAGTVANVCCESSARDASTLGYRVIFVADANAAGSDSELNATLHTVYRSFGDVRPTDEILGLLGAG